MQIILYNTSFVILKRTLKLQIYVQKKKYTALKC